ncbi:glycerol-1-phosphate dehydrogenase [NAD(P)+] [Peptococcaceae bacterium CEB3]|nr:glycerol-1-phosphate dehydrogenase [NAD(P)+] [Peptococcaceae bacterium CEB3]
MEVPSCFLNGPIQCSCGKVHVVPIKKIAVVNNAQYAIAEYLERSHYLKVLLVADTNTYDAFGRTLLRYLQGKGFGVDLCVFPRRNGLLPDEGSVATVVGQLESDGYQSVLAVGSGVINDLVRYSSFRKSLSYISVPTAPSMDGYASNMAAMQFEGLKITSAAQTPEAIFADLSVLTASPYEMLQSGFGDLVGKVISLSDWVLARTLYGEHFCQQSYDIVARPLAYVVENAEKLTQRDPEVVRSLFVGLINSGIAMAMIGNSRPCSGSEHHCSHYWDLLAYQGKRNHASHGLQVGYATYWMLRFYRKLAELDVLRKPLELQVTDEFKHYAQEFYGAGADEVIQAQCDKAAWLSANAAVCESVQMGALHAALQPTLSMLTRVEQALETIGISKDLNFVGLAKPVLRDTFLHAKELRARYTVFDFMQGQGVLEVTVDQVLEE